MAPIIQLIRCGKKKLSKDELGLNNKMIGREIIQFYYLEHFAEYFNVTTEELLIKVEEFKEKGCVLF